MTPETILGALCCTVVVLVVLRLLVGRRPRVVAGPDLGASMTIGGREVQEDCYDTLSTPSGLLIVLADGMGKAYGGRIASFGIIMPLTIRSIIFGKLLRWLTVLFSMRWEMSAVEQPACVQLWYGMDGYTMPVLVM